MDKDMMELDGYFVPEGSEIMAFAHADKKSGLPEHFILRSLTTGNLYRYDPSTEAILRMMDYKVEIL